MSLKIIAGPSGYGKTTLCLEEISKKQKQGFSGNLIYIVPEQYSLQAEKDLIRASGTGGVMQSRVLSFSRLAFNILAETGGGRRAFLGDAGKNMVMRKLLSDNSGRLSYYKNSADKPGFILELSKTITELSQYNISPEDVKKSSEALSGGDCTQTVRKLSDIAVIYEDYVAYMEKNYISSDMALDIAREKIPASSLIKNSEFFIDGFNGFTPKELGVISMLIKHSKGVSITLTISGESLDNALNLGLGELNVSDLFYETQLTAKTLAETADSAGFPLLETVLLSEPKRYKSPLMKTLERDIFNYSAKPSGINKGLRIYEAENKYDEMNDTAEGILSLVRDHGYRYKDIAVLSGSVPEYETIARSIFPAYNIPFFIDSTKDITSHPLIIFITSLVEAAAKNYSYESVFRLLKTGLTPMEREDIDIFENFCLAKGLKGWKLTGDIGFYIKNEDDEKESERIRRIHSDFLSYTGLIRGLKPDKKISVASFSRLIFETLYLLNVPERLEVRSSTLNSVGLFEKASENDQIWRTVTGIFDSMAEALGSEEVLPLEYLKILKAGFSDGSLGIIPPSYDRIILGDIERTRLPEIKALFIIGANDGIIPRAPEAEGLFSDTDRDILGRQGMKLSKDSKRKAFEENFLIYSGMTQPSHILSVSFHRQDMQGREKRPSYIINRLLKLFPEINVEKKADKKGSSLVTLPLPTLKKIQEAIARNGLPLPDELSGALDIISKNPRYSRNISMLKKGVSFKNTESPLSPKTVKSLYGSSLFSAVSRLESYAACPFAYYMRYGLKAKERPVYSLQTPDIGSFFHMMLERFSKYTEENGMPWNTLSKEDISLAVDKIYGESAKDFNNEIFLSSGSLSYLSKRLSEVSKRAIFVLASHIKAGSFVPAGYEVGFGGENALPPIVIGLPGGEKMIMTGKIDRVDIMDSNGKKYVKIIDYKSGSKSFDLQNIYYGLELQLMIYLDAFLQSGGEACEFLPGGVFYFRIKNPLVSNASDLSDGEIESLILKELKMSGLMLKNKDVISGLDKGLVDEHGGLSGSSDIVPVEIKKDGELKSSSSAADYESFIGLIDYAKEKARDLGSAIYSGNIDISPYKSGSKSPCIYCPFKSACRFDPQYGGKYRYLKRLDKTGFLETLKQRKRK